MPKVKVRYFALLRELLDNTREEDYEVKDGTLLADLLLKYIPERHRNAARRWEETLFETGKGEIKFNKGGTPSLRGYYLILVNGISHRSISQNGGYPGLRYMLKDADEIVILPPVGGG